MGREAEVLACLVYRGLVGGVAATAAKLWAMAEGVVDDTVRGRTGRYWMCISD